MLMPDTGKRRLQRKMPMLSVRAAEPGTAHLPGCNFQRKNVLILPCKNISAALNGRRISWMTQKQPFPQRPSGSRSGYSMKPLEKAKPLSALKRQRQSPTASSDRIHFPDLFRKSPTPPTMRFARWNRKMWVWKRDIRQRKWQNTVCFMPGARCGRQNPSAGKALAECDEGRTGINPGQRGFALPKGTP